MSGAKRVSGACLCGAVRFTITLPTLFCAHCHCTMCRRNHGAAYVTWTAVPPAQLSLDSGAEALTRYASSEHGSRTFCARCGTSLFCENTAHHDRVDIPVANLLGPIDREPQLHVFYDDRAEWTRIGDALPKLGGATGLEPTK
ncbi:MAG: GFA family protein [Deltaproteobacteria bacterium]|nr:GFA family protein [Deltaproteobacteria bacterium]